MTNFYLKRQVVLISYSHNFNSTFRCIPWLFLFSYTAHPTHSLRSNPPCNPEQYLHKTHSKRPPLTAHMYNLEFFVLLHISNVPIVLRGSCLSNQPHFPYFFSGCLLNCRLKKRTGHRNSPNHFNRYTKNSLR